MMAHMNGEHANDPEAHANDSEGHGISHGNASNSEDDDYDDEEEDGAEEILAGIDDAGSND